MFLTLSLLEGLKLWLLFLEYWPDFFELSPMNDRVAVFELLFAIKFPIELPDSLSNGSFVESLMHKGELFYDDALLNKLLFFRLGIFEVKKPLLVFWVDSKPCSLFDIEPWFPEPIIDVVELCCNEPTAFLLIWYDDIWLFAVKFIWLLF